LILVPVFVLAVYYLFRMGSIVDRIVNVDAPAANYAQQASIQVLEARRAERNYLLLHGGVYLEANRTALDKTRQDFERIRDLEPGDRVSTDQAFAALQTYQQRFAAAMVHTAIC
jgi:CHASE3 domain sensor protein